jgi:hypothetical protein
MYSTYKLYFIYAPNNTKTGTIQNFEIGTTLKSLIYGPEILCYKLSLMNMQLWQIGLYLSRTLSNNMVFMGSSNLWLTGTTNGKQQGEIQYTYTCSNNFM